MKRSLDELCLFHLIGVYQLSVASKLDLRAVAALLLGYQTTRRVVEQALDGLNTLTGANYIIEDIEVHLTDGEE